MNNPQTKRQAPYGAGVKPPGKVHDGKSRPSPGKTSPARLALHACGKMAAWIICNRPRMLEPGNTTMTNTDDDLSTLDVIRCIFLARMTERRGHAEAARRWQAKVDTWLARQGGCVGRVGMVEPDGGSDQ